MADIRLRLNHRNMAALLRSDQMRPPLRVVAERGAHRARETAPVDEGDYRDGIRVAEDTTDRARVKIVATDRKSAVIEAKTGNLKRALGSL